MGERRKFDPTRLPPVRKSRNLIRMMLPMTLCCNTCGNQMSKGSNFTSRIEKLLQTSSATHHHLVDRTPAAFRFYFRCPHCCSHLSMRSDPINFDYILESGATRIPKRRGFYFDFGEEEFESVKRRKLEQEEEEFRTPTSPLQSEGDGELELLDLSFEERRLENNQKLEHFLTARYILGSISGSMKSILSHS